MNTKEEIEAADEYAEIETQRYIETHPSKYEDDGSRKYRIRCKSDFLAGLNYQKQKQLTELEACWNASQAAAISNRYLKPGDEYTFQDYNNQLTSQTK